MPLCRRQNERLLENASAAGGARPGKVPTLAPSLGGNIDPKNIPGTSRCRASTVIFNIPSEERIDQLVLHLVAYITP